MKSLILGATGQIGHELVDPFSSSHAVVTAARDPNSGAMEVVDAADRGALETMLARVDPDQIINAAAYTAVDRAEEEPELAFRLNADLPGWLAGWCAERDRALVHYSTDYVFDGCSDSPYVEDDDCAPLGIYGRSKLAGEVAIRSSGCRHLILRTCWVYGARGHNFLRSILRAAGERDRLTIVDDQWGSPSWSRSLARLTHRAVAVLESESDWRRLGGTYHLSARGSTTWCRFATAFIGIAVRDGLLARAPVIEPITSEQWPTPARRPAYSVLDSSRFERAFEVAIPDWESQMTECMADMRAV